MNPTDLAFPKANVALLADFPDSRREEIASGSRVEISEPGGVIVNAGQV